MDLLFSVVLVGLCVFFQRVILKSITHTFSGRDLTEHFVLNCVLEKIPQLAINVYFATHIVQTNAGATVEEFGGKPVSPDPTNNKI